jgi:threonine dehydrogenase-like Zn-dependent dehydrogenase
VVRAMVLEKFGASLVERDYPQTPLADGEVRVTIAASGICGSDLHMAAGKDPRIPLPIILGHEAVGYVEEIGGEKLDVNGRRLEPGQLLAWDRGVTCGKCVFCVVKRQSYLCTNRKVYGINMSCAEAPHLVGGYAEKMHLSAGTNVLVIEGDVDPVALVAAGCSGATAAHAVEESGIQPGGSAVVQGAGPLGLFCAAMLREKGAAQVVITNRRPGRLEAAPLFGVTRTLCLSQTGEQEQAELIAEASGGLGPDVVINTTGNPQSIRTGIGYCRRGGTYVEVGVAVPVGETPVSFYEEVALKNLRIQGVWVSDTSHFCRAVGLVTGGRYPFEKLVSHRFPLSQANQAQAAAGSPESVKVVLVPEGEA